jgi:hypothetical protein
MGAYVRINTWPVAFLLAAMSLLLMSLCAWFFDVSFALLGPRYALDPEHTREGGLRMSIDTLLISGLLFVIYLRVPALRRQLLVCSDCEGSGKEGGTLPEIRLSRRRRAGCRDEKTEESERRTKNDP